MGASTPSYYRIDATIYFPTRHVEAQSPNLDYSREISRNALASGSCDYERNRGLALSGR